MRYLKLIILVLAYAVISPAFADVCCPSGCVPTYAYNSTACVYTGTQNFCGYGSTCSGGSGRSSGGSGSGQTYVSPPQVPPQCIPLNPTKATVDAATNKCVNDLTGNAMFWGCLFEDDAGRAEDQRTGLTCAERQAALAKQCLKRCAAFASYSTHTFCVGSDPNYVWHIFFGDIQGEFVGSARVDLCGPRLRSGVASRLRAPLTRYQP
jgi:hypothetical protein